jgi:hypothetical protein
MLGGRLIFSLSQLLCPARHGFDAARRVCGMGRRTEKAADR